MPLFNPKRRDVCERITNDRVFARPQRLQRTKLQVIDEEKPICTCRDARQWGKICAHGVAVGLHWLEARKRETAPSA